MQGTHKLDDVQEIVNYLKQLLDNRLALKYMNGESAREYKKALGASSVDNIKPLVNYIENQKDLIVENRNMF